MGARLAPENMILSPGTRKLFLYATFVLYLCVLPGASAQDSPSAPLDASPKERPGTPQSPHRIRRPTTIDDQVKSLTQRLDLDTTQQSMVKIILERSQTELLDVFKDGSLSAVDRFNAMKAVHETANDRIARILNPEQAKKFEAMRNHTPALNLPKREAPTPPKA